MIIEISVLWKLNRPEDQKILIRFVEVFPDDLEMIIRRCSQDVALVDLQHGSLYTRVWL